MTTRPMRTNSFKRNGSQTSSASSSISSGSASGSIEGAQPDQPLYTARETEEDDEAWTSFGTPAANKTVPSDLDGTIGRSNLRLNVQKGTPTPGSPSRLISRRGSFNAADGSAAARNGAVGHSTSRDGSPQLGSGAFAPSTGPMSSSLSPTIGLASPPRPSTSSFERLRPATTPATVSFLQSAASASASDASPSLQSPAQFATAMSSAHTHDGILSSATNGSIFLPSRPTTPSGSSVSSASRPSPRRQDNHARYPSLTSACLPATASYTPTSSTMAQYANALGRYIPFGETLEEDRAREKDLFSPSVPRARAPSPMQANHASFTSINGSSKADAKYAADIGLGFAGTEKSGIRSTSNSSTSSATSSISGLTSDKRWLRMFKWMRPASALSSSGSAPVMRAYRDKEDVLAGSDDEEYKLSKSRGPAPRPTHSRRLSKLPQRTAVLVLGPFSSFVLPDTTALVQARATHSRVVPVKKKRALVLRFLTAAYIIFALFHFSSTLWSALLRSSGASQARLVAREQQQVFAANSAYSSGQAKLNDWAETVAQGFTGGRDRLLQGVGYRPNPDSVAASLAPSLDIDSDAAVLDEEPEQLEPIAAPTVAEEVLPMPNQVGRANVTVLRDPLSLLSHPYRMSKMHSKVGPRHYEHVEPYAFRATSASSTAEVTACLYINEIWLPQLAEFAKRWQGPISLVYETPYQSSNVEQRTNTLKTLSELRNSDSIIKQLVDFHVISQPQLSDYSLNKTYERLIAHPVGSNYHMNVARFFARTDMVWMAGDARLLPSNGLRRRLAASSVRKVVLDSNDAVIVPVFSAIRRDAAGEALSLSSIDDLREQRAPVLNEEWELSGVSPAEFAPLGKRFYQQHLSTLDFPLSRWPKRKATLVGLSSLHPPVSVAAPGETVPERPVFALYDREWAANRGPSNWQLWRKARTDPRLADSAESGGGQSLGVNGTIGGGSHLYKVTDYDLHYSPHLVISREAQPWCTERFQTNQAACVYQMYLSGAELYVLPDEWAFTLEPVQGESSNTMDEADRIKTSISSRLYTKFHQEACMHYGRGFLSLDQWQSDRATHLRFMCERVHASWGVGLLEPPKPAAAR
ncbi:uncharacterized protein L969DRAFT_89664 [Mixia osmundae IAM 14324]|uniref:Glycosyltransferase family 49 protein n=1 Tax=Mixia osmundae (strain CBS 9802 / IAM 14324 / JCM 22182 / KY 12970) TaxID=764103 RepID=G7DVH6_MIXOS|nr:uncharacterized protein L969DRAFT_89664 [Mixia osmundae IAM 14324]KEI37694.1 hypothetical protein L969DRAFT_89664 [Mixia osmundae IAM 14324]GAA94586.1 hypothetical protein E5Q_01238 [Mixia osmundae IAM 14324]